MAAIKRDKADDFEEYEDSRPEAPKLIDNLTIIMGVLFLILSEAFFYLLSVKTGAAFTWVQIVFGIIISLVITLFLFWTKFVMANNKYMGGLMALVGILGMYYALTRRYQGVYTTAFLIAGILIALGYLGINIFRNRK